jgi:predicted transcriptional regulator
LTLSRRIDVLRRKREDQKQYGALVRTVQTYVDLIALEASRRGLTEREIADRAGVCRETAKRHLSGAVRRPSLPAMGQLCGALGYEIRIRSSGKDRVSVQFHKQR